MNSLRNQARFELFDLLRAGEIDPPEAERRAARLGIGPLRALPPRELFAPESEPHWSVSMTIAWISWRSLDRVREVWDRYRLEIFDWRHSSEVRVNEAGEPEIREFWEPVDRRPMTYAQLAIEEAMRSADDPDETDKIMSYRMARTELSKAASIGSVESVAISCRTSEPVSIPRHEWPYLELIVEDETDCLVRRGDAGTYSFAKVVFNSRDVIKEWPEIATRGASQRKSFAEFLQQKISASLHEPTMTKGDATRIGMETYGLSRSECERVWTSTIEALRATAWTKPGRRKRKSAD